MKNLLLAASAALFSFAAVAQTGPATVAGQTPADGRAYGQAVSTAAQAKNDKYVKTPKPAKLAKYDKQARPLTDAEKDAYKAQQDARKDAYKAQAQQQKDAYKDRKDARKDAGKDQEDARKDARKDAYKDRKDARKDADKSAKMVDTRADKMEKHERSARGEHAHGGDRMGRAKPVKEHKEHKVK